MNFNQLTQTLIATHTELHQNSVKAVNIELTLRNWLFGYYIVEFEQNGEDRAKYGKQLLSNLVRQLSIKGLTAPELSRCRQFYSVYSQTLGALSQESESGNNNPIFGALPQKFKRKLLILKFKTSIIRSNQIMLIFIEDLINVCKFL